MTLRVLSISTLYPAPSRPAFGAFVAHQMEAVAVRGDVDLLMVNPIGIPPWPLSRREPYRSLSTNPFSSERNRVAVMHPRFTTLPLLGDGNPARMAAALLPLARRLHARQPFDVVDAQFFFPDGPAAARIAADLGLPLSIKARGSDVLLWGRRPRALRQIRAAAGQAAGILSVSGALRADMIAMGLPGERIAVHYTGLDHARFRPMPRETARARLAFTLSQDAPLLVATGALIAIKGQALAIEALALVPDAHLALAGKGPDEAPLRALADRLGLAGRVHFLGQVSHDDLPGLIAAADAMVLPSEREGLANAWIEALACGTPLVIPDIGGAREVVTAPEAGRIAPRDAAGIAQACRELLAEPPQRHAVAAHAARFSWETNATELVAHWARLARG